MTFFLLLAAIATVVAAAVTMPLWRGGDADTRPRPVMAAGVALSLGFGGLGLYGLIGAPQLALGGPSAPARPEADVASVDPAQEREALVDMAMRLQERVDDDPNDASAWLILAQARARLNENAAAAEAFGQAAALQPDDPTLASVHGEALIRAADGAIGPEAKAAFQRADALDPHEPRAQFYLGLADAQAGLTLPALERWARLIAVSPPDAPWVQPVRAEAEATAAATGTDFEPVLDAALAKVPDRPAPRGPTQADIEAAQQMTPDEQLAMIENMVGNLAARLEDNPDDVEGWRRLAQAYRVLGRDAEAAEAASKAQAAAARKADEAPGG